MMCTFRPKLLCALALGTIFALSGCVLTTGDKRADNSAKTGPQTASLPSADRSPGAYKVGTPYEVAGRWYYPKVDYDYSETGIASWYGPGFHGKTTANGETYDQNALTAAHRTLPMPSMVRVTNLDNGRSIKVRINDRGPFKNSRIIDLSKRAADLLGFSRKGTAKVRVEIVEDESRLLAARALSEEAAAQAPDAAPRVPVAVAELPAAGQAGAAPTQAETPAASQTAMVVPRANDHVNGREIHVPVPDGIVSRVPVARTRIYVQAGSFTLIYNAHKLRTRLSKVGKAKISSAMVDNRRHYRVRFGPLASVAEADRLLALLNDNGHNDARVVVD